MADHLHPLACVSQHQRAIAAYDAVHMISYTGRWGRHSNVAVATPE